MLTLIINKLSYKIIISILSFTIFVSIIIFSIEKKVGEDKIWIEVENAIDVIEPLKIVKLEGASNGLGIKSVREHLKNSGIAKYQINTKGSYYVWGRCYWSLVCSNSFRISIDQSNSIIFGENPILKKWHWIQGPKFEITEGKHELILWSQEENSQIEKILLTSDNCELEANKTIRMAIIFKNTDDINRSNNVVWTIMNGDHIGIELLTI